MRKYGRFVSFFLSLSVVPLDVLAAPPERSNLVAIAGLLGGNTLVPLAQFVAGRWVTTWPKPGEQVELKFSKRDDLPK